MRILCATPIPFISISAQCSWFVVHGKVPLVLMPTPLAGAHNFQEHLCIEDGHFSICIVGLRDRKGIKIGSGLRALRLPRGGKNYSIAANLGQQGRNQSWCCSQRPGRRKHRLKAGQGAGSALFSRSRWRRPQRPRADRRLGGGRAAKRLRLLLRIRRASNERDEAAERGGEAGGHVRPHRRRDERGGGAEAAAQAVLGERRAAAPRIRLRTAAEHGHGGRCRQLPRFLPVRGRPGGAGAAGPGGRAGPQRGADRGGAAHAAGGGGGLRGAEQGGQGGRHAARATAGRGRVAQPRRRRRAVRLRPGGAGCGAGVGSQVLGGGPGR
mmetsp:Transcript_12740/g.27243  ORF Transcript_12740/g.27243 Transcript_12740/m.27243 type:complete len:325 (-) Transcript_12740:77-1051(-)